MLSIGSRRNKMKFNRTENEKIKSTDGRDFWISRSAAVIMHLFINSKVMVVKRGPKSHNFVDHWCLPCGFLDWDESAPQACVREFWEETGVNLHDIIEKSDVVYNGLVDGPWKVVTEPELDGMQNVCLHYGLCLECPDFSFDDTFSNEETAKVELVEVDEFVKRQVAFNHSERILEFISLLERKTS